MDGCEGITREILVMKRAGNIAFRASPLAVLEQARKMFTLATDPAWRKPARYLVVTFKSVVQDLTCAAAIADMFPNATKLHLKWYGAVAGTNQYMQDAENECDCFVTLGDYYPNRRWMYDHIARGVNKWTDEDKITRYINAAGKKSVQQELMQAHGRARDVRRTKPCAHLHFGKTWPLDWKHNPTQVTRWPEESDAARKQDDMLTMLLAATSPGQLTQRRVAELIGVSEATVSQWLSGVHAIPEDMFQPLEQVAVFQTNLMRHSGDATGEDLVDTNLPLSAQ